MARNEIDSIQRRTALTSAYLKVICPHIDQRKRTQLGDSILSLIGGGDRPVPRKQITDAQAIEIVWRNSQCVRNQTGRCPLLIFGKQLADELNEFFASEERSGDAS